MSSLRDNVERIFNQHQAMQERIDRLESALRFYADRTNYDGKVFVMGEPFSEIQMDGGERARVTLYGRPDEEVD